MPQVDTVSSGCAGVVVTGYPNDSKIAALALDDPPASDLPDFAPESFFLSKDAELDWLDRNAFIERKDSGKGGGGGSLPPSSSQKYSLSVKTKPSFIGLPKSQKAAYGEAKPRGRPPSIRLFPKRSQSSKSEAPMADPTSPKVSCIGRVRSRRERSLRKKKKSQKQADPAINRSMSIRSHKTGRFWTNLLSIFGSRGHKQAENEEETGGGSKSKSLRTCNRRLKKSKSLKKQRNKAGAGSSEGSSATDPPPTSLMAVKQFTSGRRSDAWAAELCSTTTIQVEPQLVH